MAKYWEDHHTYKVSNDDPRPKYYVLEMFPYPSGNLHMGHVRNYSIGDVVARFRTMRATTSFIPWALTPLACPRKMPPSNITFRRPNGPLKTLPTWKTSKTHGLSYDWDREVKTCMEDYYKWTQWFFELMYKARPGR